MSRLSAPHLDKKIRWSVIAMLARAELKAALSGFARGFRIFLICLIIGVAAAAAAGSAAEAFRKGLAERARAITGGDVRVDLRERELPAEALQWLQARGQISVVTDVRAMSYVGEGLDASRKLVELRAVDDYYPLEGQLVLADASGKAIEAPFRPLLTKSRSGAFGAIAQRGFADALGIRPGEEFQIGAARFYLAGTLAKEPDAIGQGFALAPRLIVAQDALPAAGLARPGSLYEVSWRVALRGDVDPDQVAKDWNKTFPQFAERMTSRSRAAPGLVDFIGRLEIFLIFVAITALLAGGLGVQGAVRAFLEARRPQIATLKALGVSGNEIRMAYSLEILGLTCVGSLIGIALGSCVPPLLGVLVSDALPLPSHTQLFAKPLFAALLMGIFTAIAFAAGPIGQARATSPQELYRGRLKNQRFQLETLLSLFGFLGLMGVSAWFSADKIFALAIFVGGLLVFGLLRALGHGLQFLARALHGRFGGASGQALANLGGPGSLAPQMAPAIGFGVLLLAALTQIHTNLVAQIEGSAPKNLPSILFTEIPYERADAFDGIVKSTLGPLDAAHFQRAPVLTARVVSINGREINREEVNPAERWFVSGDLSVSYASQQPAETSTVEGKWWPPGPLAAPEVSIEADAAKGIGAKIGDRIGFDVLGRPIEAKLTHLRKIDWGGWGTNFAVLFSPGLLEAANPRMAAIVRLSPQDDDKLAKAVGAEFPNVGIVRIRDALKAAGELLDKMAFAIRATAGIALLSGALAVAGALVASLRRRLYDAAILKALGATRARILMGFAMETALAGLASAGIGALLGFAIAYPIVTRAFEAKWVPAFGDVAFAGLVAFLGLVIAGLVLGVRALSSAPHRLLAAELSDYR